MLSFKKEWNFIPFFFIGAGNGICTRAKTLEESCAAVTPYPRIFVGVLGFEPRLNPPKGLVLPLHYTPKN